MFEQGTVVVPRGQFGTEQIVGIVIGDGAVWLFDWERRVFWLSDRRGPFVSLEAATDLSPARLDETIGDLDTQVMSELLADALAELTKAVR